MNLSDARLKRLFARLSQVSKDLRFEIDKIAPNLSEEAKTREAALLAERRLAAILQLPTVASVDDPSGIEAELRSFLLQALKREFPLLVSLGRGAE